MIETVSDFASGIASLTSSAASPSASELVSFDRTALYPSPAINMTFPSHLLMMKSTPAHDNSRVNGEVRQDWIHGCSWYGFRASVNA